jgi:hypothetical protein
MSCCSTKGCGENHTPVLPDYYNLTKTFCGVFIVALAIKVDGQRFAISTGVGLAIHALVPHLTEDITNLPEGCASGCTDIVAQSLSLKLDSRLCLIVATLFFCCHIEHHGKEMVPVVGALCGARLFHTLQIEKETYQTASGFTDYLGNISNRLCSYYSN